MIEYAKVILWGVSFWKALFKKELKKIITWSNSTELAELRKYCYDKYYDMHPDVLDEVFSTTTVSIPEVGRSRYTVRRPVNINSLNRP